MPQSDQGPQGGDGHTPVVLVVDDEEAMRDSCEQVLTREGFEVVTAPGGRGALEAMSRKKPDVMLVDLKMPGMSGEEFLAEARKIDPEVVAVAITGYPTLGAAIDVMKGGAYDFLPKPFKAEELRMIMDRAVEKRRLALDVAAGERERQRMHDNFAAMVAHQLKAPAASLKECLDTALATLGEGASAGCRDLIRRAAAKAGLLLDLMEDWLTLARVESRGVDVDEQRVEVGPILRAAITAARENPDRNDVAVELNEPGEPVRLRGDAEALRELFFNLVDNAMRYTPDGGRVHVELGAEGGYVVVAVADTGPGIPAEEREVIFEPFFRGDEAKKRQGTGLGLAIARQIAEAHGGRIAVETELGQGTTFEVLLPQGEEGE
ncbi:MAG: hybrid sensor histidine kinase/response regulator [Candidatus Brocadiia bacterium]